MAAKTLCPECGSNESLVSDFHVSQEHLVCTRCGYVANAASSRFKYETDTNDGTKFTSAAGSSITRLASKLKYADTKQSDTSIILTAKGRLNDVACNYGLNKEMTKEATDMFDKALAENDFFKQLDEQKKISLAGCCVYVVSRMHDFDVALLYVANYLGVQRHSIIHMLNDLTETLELRIPGITLDGMAWSFLGEMSCNLEANEKIEMYPTVQALIDIGKRALITEGVNAHPFFLAASYVAWCCLIFPPRKTQFSQFCKLMGMKRTETSRVRLRELTVLLVQMATSIPWLAKHKITHKNVFFHVDTIIKYRRTLASARDGDVEKPNLFYEIFEKRRKRNIPLAESSADNDADEAAYSGSKDDDDIDVIPEQKMVKYIKSPEELEYIEKIQITNVK